MNNKYVDHDRMLHFVVSDLGLHTVNTVFPFGLGQHLSQSDVSENLFFKEVMFYISKAKHVAWPNTLTELVISNHLKSL